MALGDGGLLLFGAFWFFVTFAVAHGTRLVRTLQTPYFKAVALLVTLLVCMQMLVSYGDQQLTEYRTMVYRACSWARWFVCRSIERQEALQGGAPPSSRALALHSANADALDEEALADDEDEEHREDHDHGARAISSVH